MANYLYFKASFVDQDNYLKGSNKLRLVNLNTEN